MKLTKNQIIFSVIGVAISMLYFIGMDSYATKVGDRGGYMLVVAAALAIVWTGVGWLLLRFEKTRKHRANLSLGYHLLAVVTAQVASILAYYLLKNYHAGDLLWVTIVGGGSLLIHWLTARQNPKGIDKEEAFL
jgi:EamA domain-containing membrane protein RarD